MRIAVIVVAYHTKPKEINRLRHETAILDPCAFIVIDNTRNQHGFSQGANEGIREALKKERPDALLILNPDIHFTRLSQAAFAEAYRHFDLWGGIFTQRGKTYYGGTIDRWNMAGGLQIVKPQKKLFASDFVSGSCMAIKSELFATIGFLNEQYFMYYEDTEFSFRAKKAGYMVGCSTDITYEHFEQSRASAKKDYYLKRNRLLFLWEHGTLWQKMHECAAALKHIRRILPP